MLARLEALAPRAPWLVPLIAAVVFLPAVAVPFIVDDWLFLAMLEGNPVFPPREPWNLFHLDFGTEPWPGGVQGIAYPWWSDPAFHAHFFRPISSLTHWLDHRLFGRIAALHHLSSIAMYAGLVALVGALYRRMTTPWVALLAVLIFAVDDCHTWPVSWLANRNGMLGVVGAAGLLYGHHRWRSGDGPRWLAVSLLSYLAGLCSSEAALAGVGYVFAYELFLSRGSLAGRARAAAPAVGMAFAYLAFWKIGNYGTVASGMYLNPFDQPARFLLFALPTRIPMLLLAALTPVPVDLSFLLTEPQQWAAATASALLVTLLLAPLVPLLRRDPTARMALLGAAIALIPISATFAAGRNLMLPTLGLAYVLARAIVDGFAGEGSRGLAKLLVLFHLILAPLGVWAGVGMLYGMGVTVNAEALDTDIPDADVEDLRVVVLNTQSPMTGLYLRILRAIDGQPMPAAIWPLVAAPVDQELVRTGPSSLRLRAAEPGYLGAPFELLTRPHPEVEPGETWTSGGMTVRATEVRDGRLLAFEATFDRSLDDPDLLLLAWDGDRLARFEPPAVGACVPVPLPVEMFGVEGARRAPPSDTCAAQDPPKLAAAPVRPAPTPSEDTCTLDLKTAAGWLERARIPCPGEEGLGVVSLGDIGLPGELLSASTDQIAARCAQEPCHLIAMPGDLMYVPGDGAARAWELIWDRTLARLELPGLGVLGNHEYRHEPDPAGKRAALYGADGRAGFVLPASSWTMRVARDGRPLYALAGLDTDSVANPGPDMPGLGLEALEAACALDVPTIVLGHHPSSSQGLHHGHEAHVEAAMTRTLAEAAASGCRIPAYLAGHDHDLQAWPPGCESPGSVGTVVSGVAARGYRPGGSTHLTPCPASRASGSYHADRPGAGFAVLRVRDDASTDVRLYDVPAPGRHDLLSSQRW